MGVVSIIFFFIAIIIGFVNQDKAFILFGLSALFGIYHQVYRIAEEMKNGKN